MQRRTNLSILLIRIGVTLLLLPALIFHPSGLALLGYYVVGVSRKEWLTVMASAIVGAASLVVGIWRVASTNRGE